MVLYTAPAFTDYHPNFPIISSHTSGGIHTKMSSIAAALRCGMISSLDGVQGNLIVEPLVIKAPHTEEADYPTEQWANLENKRIQALKDYPYRKILLCSEMEPLRWTGNRRSLIVESVNQKVYASCVYQQRLFQSLGIKSEVIYEPINEFLFYPTEKNPKQIITTGATKSLKNTQMVIDVYRALEGKGYHRVHVGSPIMWNFDWHESHIKNSDTRLYHELKEVCDEFHDASSATFVARKMSESSFYLNFAYHEVCCRSAGEAMMAGCGVIGGEHPLWNEYPVLGKVKTSEECVRVLDEHVGDTAISQRVRDWAVECFGFTRFSEQIKQAFEE